jgi:hypothetical protein
MHGITSGLADLLPDEAESSKANQAAAHEAGTAIERAAVP